MFPITQICRADTCEAIDLEISLPEELATLAHAVNNGGLYLGGVAGCLRDSRAEDCAFVLSLTALGGEGQTIHAGDVAGSIQGESTLVNCVHWERMDSPVRELENGGNAYDDA